MNNLVTKSDLSSFYEKILPYLGGGTKLAGPVGMIISYMGTTAPNGYLACDGSWFDIGDYPKLANWMMEEFESYSYFALSGETVPTGKFKVPDLRGEFLRGTGTNSHSGCGNGADIGTHQDSTRIPFLNVMTDGNAPRLQIFGSSSNVYLQNLDGGIGTRSWGGDINSAKWDTSGTTSLFGIRPTNTSVLYCIKYEEYEGNGAGEVYSTTERVVGKWIDGKPLYQKTYDVTTSVKAVTVFGDATNLVDIADLNIEDVISITGSMNVGGISHRNIPHVYGGSNYRYGISYSVDTSANKLQAFFDYSYTTAIVSTIQKAYATLQYTKTT